MAVTRNPKMKKEKKPPATQKLKTTAKTTASTRSSTTRKQRDHGSDLEPTLVSKQDQLAANSTRKRTKSPGIRLIGRRIYDSVNGKTCHQCRQKTMDFSVSCTHQSDHGKQCTVNFCHICLSNRYGENAEEAAMMEDWKCPKCRGVCNCSYCMKKRGCCPTGTLFRAAKAEGFSSVSDMLNVKGFEKAKKDECGSLKKRAASNEAGGAVLTKRRKGNGVNRRNDAKLISKPLKGCSDAEKKGSLKVKKGTSKKNSEMESALCTARQHTKRKSLDRKSDAKSQRKLTTVMLNKKKISTGRLQISKEGDKIGGASVEKMHSNKERKKATVHEKQPIKIPDSVKCIDTKNVSVNNEILLPRGTELSNLADINIPAEDIGHALQFLEFCEAFGQVLNLTKGQPENLLRKLASSRSSIQNPDQSVAQFHIKLLSIIQENSGNDCSSLKTRGQNLWLDALSKFILESQSPSKEFPLGCSSMDPDTYEALTTSKKLRLLNFLCDEALGTVKLRSWIDEQNTEEEKKAREIRNAEKEKEKSMKKKLQDEVAKAALTRNGVPFSISEYQDLVSKIKSEAAQTLAETLEATEMVLKKEQRTDAVRSEPILCDVHGRRFWKLRSYSGAFAILLQGADICNEDMITFNERWVAYSAQEKTLVEKYICSLRKQYQHEKEAACPSFYVVKQEGI